MKASFRQDSTLHATWSRVGHPPEVPVPGQRKSVKILGAIELWKARFHYQQESVFNAATYLAFLDKLARRYRYHGVILIQDNASYHKKAAVWDWFAANRDWLGSTTCRRTLQNSILRNAFGNTPAKTERTTATSKTRASWWAR